MDRLLFYLKFCSFKFCNFDGKWGEELRGAGDDYDTKSFDREK